MDERAGRVARLPGWALGVSLALHGLFLAVPAWHALRQARPPLPLLATLRAAAPVRIETPAVANVPTPTAPAAARAHARPARTHETAAPPPIHTANEPAHTANEPPAPAAPSRAPLIEAPPAQRAEAPPPEPPAAAMANYARFLAGLLAQRRDYPRLAAQRGWQGEVRLGVQVARKGAIVAVQVLQSSGYELLDRHALQLVRETATLPQLPVELLEREFRIVVPIHYRLEKTT